MAMTLPVFMRSQGNIVTVSQTLDSGIEVVYTATATPGNSAATLKQLMSELESDLAGLAPESDDE